MFRVCSSRKLVKIHNTYLQLFVLSRLFSPQKIDWDKKLMAHKIVNYKKVKLQVATLCLKSINSKTALKYIFILLNKQAESHIFHILLNHFQSHTANMLTFFILRHPGTILDTAVVSQQLMDARQMDGPHKYSVMSHYI